MNLSRTKVFASVIAVVFVAGCSATTGVMPKGNDVYTINVYRGDADKVKLRAYQHAQKFCAKTGEKAQMVKENLRDDPNFAKGTASIMDLDFKCSK